MLVIIPSITMTLYLVFVMCRYGVQDSISASYYRLTDGWRLLFTVVLWVQTFCLLPVMIDVTPPAKPVGTLLAFLSMGGVAFVGAAPNLTDKEESKVHYCGAWTAAVASQLWVACVHPWWLLLWLAAVPLLWIRNNATWWTEIESIYIIYTVLYEKIGATV